MNKNTLAGVIRDTLTEELRAFEAGNPPYVPLRNPLAYKVCGITVHGDTHFIVTSDRGRCITAYGQMLINHSSVYVHLGTLRFDEKNVEGLP